MRYVIDGYNFLFRNMVAGEELQLQRDAIIYDLNVKASTLNLDITIVFDAHYSEGDSTVTHYRNIEIIYTAEGMSADDHIIKSLKHVENPKNYTLVTSDNKLAWQARCQLVKTQSVEKFIAFLEKRSLNKQRQHEKPQRELPKLLKPKPPVKQTRDPLPAENSIDYYEQIFTKKLKKITNTSPEISSQKRSELRNKKKQVPIKKEGESDLDRWLRIFEKRSRE
ncbi:MAG: NYN domain-containing protein [Chlamydiota bacterium]|nr:NYN domain-containing protein [Chlamydiota bacterium]